VRAYSGEYARFGDQPLGHHPSDRFSFPSGHTSSAFATAAVLERHYGWKVGVPAYAAATYVGGSRLSENKHYLSDVIFGAAIGVVCGRATTVGSGRARMAMSPIAAPGGAGVEFTWLGRTRAAPERG
jgi:membrane-associated phospholipid phosphatase